MPVGHERGQLMTERPDGDPVDSERGPRDGNIVVFAQSAVQEILETLMKDRHQRGHVVGTTLEATESDEIETGRVVPDDSAEGTFELTDVVHEALSQATDRVAAAMQAVVSDWAQEARGYHEGFTERLRGHQGAGLDSFRAFIDLCVQSPVYLHERGTVDMTGNVILDLHARACLAAQEVHTLLANGFPTGALATWRTIHECAVIASLLNGRGRADDHALTRMWLDYGEVQRHDDAVEFNKHAATLGYDPFPVEILDMWQRRVDDARRGRNKQFGHQYGWASEITKPRRPNFYQLERLAGLGHLRGHYQWASHRVHADARGTEMNWFTRGERQARLVGPTNTQLVDPADLAMGSLSVATNCVLNGAHTGGPQFGEVVTMQVLGRFREEASNKLLEGDHQIAQAEEELQARLAQEMANDGPSKQPKAE